MRRRRLLLGCTGALLLGLAGIVAGGLGEASATPQIRRVEVALPGLDATSGPVRVALLSDIHFGNRAMPRRRLDGIVDQVNAERPDLVVIAGDFVNGYRGDEGLPSPTLLTAPLARLNARYGVIATLGNHEYWTDPAGVTAALQAAGITVLENRPARRGPLLVIGLSDRFSGHDDIAGALAAADGMAGVPVVLTHSPDVVRDLPPAMTLLLAGHTHCGQIVLPLLGPIFQASPTSGGRQIYDPRYRCGVIRDPGRTTIVTAGLGSGTIPIRLGAPPDWWLVTLVPEP